MRASWRVVAALAGLSLTGCSQAPAQTPTNPTGGPPAIVGLVLVGLPQNSMVMGQTIRLRTVVRYADGTSRDVTSGTTWASTNAMVAPISASGEITALAIGSTTVSAHHDGMSASSALTVSGSWADDLDFRVAVLNAAAAPRPAADVTRVLGLAGQILQTRTGARMRIVDFQEVGPGDTRTLATAYLTSLSGDMPDGVLIWADDATAVGFGGYSIQITMPAPYTNRYPSLGGDSRVYIAAIHWSHKYSRCGYDTTGEVRISDRSANGECRNQSGLFCVNNGRFWECPGASGDLYGQPDVFTASSIVHEFMHPFGPAGNNDHYGTDVCAQRIGRNPAAAVDLRQSQEYCGMCPDVFLNFRPQVSAAMGLRRR